FRGLLTALGQTLRVLGTPPDPIFFFLIRVSQVAKQEKKKKKTGRAKRRMQYNRRFVNVVPGFGKKKGPNANS
uniref:40S ribosomal protein S30 n=1 Tax=Bubo bubo TaxID=30461 RepID=A0A8C0FH67_BUBBB